MGVHCVAYGCTNSNSSGDKSLSFHRFPHNRPDILKQWIQAVRRMNWQPSVYSRLCSLHFTSDSYVFRPGAEKKLLKDNAVPSVFNFPAHVLAKETKRKKLDPVASDMKGDLDLSDSGAPSVDGNEASDGAGPAEANDEGSSFSRDDFETCDLSDVKVKVEHTDDFCSEPETKRQRVGDYQEESKMEEALTILRDLKQSYSASQGPNDRFTLYGQHVAGKLRSYGEKTSAIVEHAINNILFEADMGNYDGIHTALPSHDDSAQ